MTHIRRSYMIYPVLFTIRFGEMSIQTQKFNPDPRLTKYLVGLGYFRSEPLVVVDVGSRGGFESCWGVYGYQVRLIGFEPDKAECKKLNDQAPPNARHYPVALSGSRGKRRLFIAQHAAASGFYRPYDRYLDRLPESANRRIVDMHLLDTVDLDSFLSENGITGVDFIKIDTEGSEMDIIAGAGKTLQNSVLGLSLELMFNRQRDGEPLFSEADAAIRQLGFQLYDLPVFRSARKILSPHMFSSNAGPTDNGQVAWTQAVYFRDGYDEIKFGRLADRWDPARILKLASLFEIFNFQDCALELIDLCWDTLLKSGLDRETLANLLVPPVDGRFVSLDEYRDHVRRDGPPRYIDGEKVSCQE